MGQGGPQVVLSRAILCALNEGICNTCDAGGLQVRLREEQGRGQKGGGVGMA